MRNLLLSLSLILLASTGSPAHAQDEPDPPADDEEYDVERVTTGRHTPLILPEGWENPADSALTPDEFRSLPYESEAYRGAEQLGLNPEYIHEVRAGLELIYNRKYKDARHYFERVDERFPGTGVSAVMNTLVWQALMLENFDFKYDSQYWVASGHAREQLDDALEVPGNEGWEHFMMTGIVGIEAIHTFRKEKYLKALELLFESMEHAEAAKEAAPEFVDLSLADGMYHYWRTVVTMNSSILPDYGDHRMEGLEEMRAVETGGIFLSSPAILALSFSYIEEGDLKLAMGAGLKNSRQYPDSIINNLVLGQVQTYMRRYDSAMDTWGRIIAVDPENNRVHYWKGVTLMRKGKSRRAVPEFEAYLTADYLEDYHRASGLYRLGQCYYRQKRYAEAETQYKEALKHYKHRGAKSSLERMKQKKKAGKIDY